MTPMEIFKCPKCDTLNRVIWDKSEQERTLPCICCARTVYDMHALQKDGTHKLWMCAEKGPQYDVSKCPNTVMSTKNKGIPVTIGQSRNIGCYMTIKRGEGHGIVLENVRTKRTIDGVEHMVEPILTKDHEQTNKVVLGQTIREISNG